MAQRESWDTTLNLVKDRDPGQSAWIGASMLGSLSTFQSNKILKTEFEEVGEHRAVLLSKRTF